MNAATVSIGLIIAALLALAIRYLVRNGTCAACGDKKACQGVKKAGESGRSCDCGGKCPSCR